MSLSFTGGRCSGDDRKEDAHVYVMPEHISTDELDIKAKYDESANDSGQNKTSKLYLGYTLPAWIALGSLVVQNSVTVLGTRYSRSQYSLDEFGKEIKYAVTACILCQEIIKLMISSAAVFILEGSCSLNHTKIIFKQNSGSCNQMFLPAVIYTFQNNLLFLALSNLDAATFQVTYQLKILTTAIFSVLLLNKILTKQQWVSQMVLIAGVVLIQLAKMHKSAAQEVNNKENLGNYVIGLVSVITCSILSAFAGVYFELLVKRNNQNSNTEKKDSFANTSNSLWMKNVQLASWSVILGFFAIIYNDGSIVFQKGFFYGFNPFLWFLIMVNSLGGLLVSLVVKYADNIMKGFATSISIIVSTVVSIYCLGVTVPLNFFVGAAVVMYAVFLYFIPMEWGGFLKYFSN